MFRTARLVLAIGALMVVGVTGGSAASTASVPTRQQIAQKILNSKAFLTSPTRSYLESVARNDHRIAPDSVGISAGQALSPKPSTSSHAAVTAGLVNVRVNNPANDTHQTDQTTQSETSVAVSGLNVAVGYNNSQHGLLFLTAGADLTGYGYSTNGGQTFTDGGALPNAPGDVNLGDPWLASDSSGAMYFSTLTLDGATSNLLVGVSKSTDGGKTWTVATPIPPPPAQCGGKGCGGPVLLLGGQGRPDDRTGHRPPVRRLGRLHVRPQDGYGTQRAARRAFHGRRPDLDYHLRQPGAHLRPQHRLQLQPVHRRPAPGRQRHRVRRRRAHQLNDPNCVGAPVTFSEAIFFSKDGGATWSAGAVQPITSSTQNLGAFQLGPGHVHAQPRVPHPCQLQRQGLHGLERRGRRVRPQPYPSGQLNSFGQFASIAYITSGSNDEVQPAMSADTGLHIAYYQIKTNAGGNSMLDVNVSELDQRENVHRPAGDQSVIPWRVHAPAVRSDHRLHLHGRLHRQRQRWDPPVHRLGRQPGHRAQLPVAKRPARPGRLLRQAVSRLCEAGARVPASTYALAALSASRSRAIAAAAPG